MQFIDLKAQYAVLKDEINANIQAVLDSAQFIGGPQVKELEKELADFGAASTASPVPTAPMPCRLPTWWRA
ncbi:MAG: hypothetical protein ACLUNQ_09205 [Oscillospiraceae bacterium]